MREQQSVPTAMRVVDLKPTTRNVDLVVRVLRIGAPQRIPDRAGGGPDKRVAEALVGDDTANALLSLWNDEIDTVAVGESIQIKGAYVRLVRGRIRICLARGALPTRASVEVQADERAANISDEEHPDEQRPRNMGRRSDAPQRSRW